MPNTLAHLGVQGLVTRGLVAGADLKWIALGCVVPDVPWIASRIVTAAFAEVPIYDLRLYAIAQSSLLLCLILAAGLAAFSTQSGRVFLILALGSALHLGIDAVQTKWGNGVHLFAPFSWELLNFGWFWPDDPATHVLTGLGVLFVAGSIWSSPIRGDDLAWPAGRRAGLAAGWILLYALLPLALLGGPEAADNHSVRTLRTTEGRAGRPVAFDRNVYARDANGMYLITFAGERLSLEGTGRDFAGKVSLRGRFLDAQTVQVTELHTHTPFVRDGASYLGLAVVGLVWLRALWTRRRSPPGASG